MHIQARQDYGLQVAKVPLIHVNFAHTYASCLNQAEQWLVSITQLAIRRGSFSGYRELITSI